MYVVLGLILLLVVIYAGFWVRHLLRIRKFLRGIASPLGTMNPLDPALVAHAMAGMIEHQRLAEELDLAFIGAFQASFPDNPPCTIFVWSSPGPGPVLSATVSATGVYVEFTTTFQGGLDLTTTQGVGGVMIPRRPGRLIESFPALSVRDLWQAHDRSLRALAERFDLKVSRDPRSFEVAMLEESRSLAGYVLSRPFWPLVCLWRGHRQSRYTGISLADRTVRDPKFRAMARA